jgi:hypothetical protein
MAKNMKLRFRLFRRNHGSYFCEERQIGRQHSLRTSDKGEAHRLLNAKNESQAQPGFSLQILALLNSFLR